MKNGIGNPLAEEFMQWISVTNYGAAAKMLLDICAALNGGLSCRAVFEALRGA